MHNGHDVGALFVDRAVDRAFRIGGAVAKIDGCAVQFERHDVFGFDQRRRARIGQQIAVRIVRVTNADMSVGIADIFMGDDAVCGHKGIDGGS